MDTKVDTSPAARQRRIDRRALAEATRGLDEAIDKRLPLAVAMYRYSVRILSARVARQRRAAR